MATWKEEEGRVAEVLQKKREAEEANKVHIG